MLGFDIMRGPEGWGRFRLDFFYGGEGYRSALFFGVFGSHWILFFPGWFASKWGRREDDYDRN